MSNEQQVDQAKTAEHEQEAQTERAYPVQHLFLLEQSTKHACKAASTRILLYYTKLHN